MLSCGKPALTQLAPLWLRVPLVQLMVTEPVVGEVASETVVDWPSFSAGVAPSQVLLLTVQLSARAEH